MIKKLFILVLIIGLASVISAFVFYNKYQDFTRHSVFSSDQVVEIKKGTHFRGFVKQIIDQGANGEEWQWRLFARWNPQLTKLTVGEFSLQQGLTPKELLQKIVNNQVITYNFTIVEGMNWRELKNQLKQDHRLLSVVEDLSDEMLLDKLGAEMQHPEGLFLPETYQFKKGDSDLDILIRAHKDLNEVLEEAWQQRSKDLPYKSSYELLIMASIVEKESALAEERDKIAGVFVRRLDLKMRLQTDPTVIYGLGKSYDGDIKTKDLKTDTPYNTYTRHGLTPTPIAMASPGAISASAHPRDGTALYFVADNRGGHYFSDTYEQHQKAVKDYLKGKKL